MWAVCMCVCVRSYIKTHTWIWWPIPENEHYFISAVYSVSVCCCHFLFGLLFPIFLSPSLSYIIVPASTSPWLSSLAVWFVLLSKSSLSKADIDRMYAYEIEKTDNMCGKGEDMAYRTGPRSMLYGWNSKVIKIDSTDSYHVLLLQKLLSISLSVSHIFLLFDLCGYFATCSVLLLFAMAYCLN